MSVTILADSINLKTKNRLTTFLIDRFPKCLQAELRTHRWLSQSHYSSRAIPVKKVIDQVTNDPFVPMWTRYKKGMGGVDDLNDSSKSNLTDLSLEARDFAIKCVLKMIKVGAAKQEINRYLEPWMYGAVTLTGDDRAWNHFFSLRTVEGVQPDFKAIAIQMIEEYIKNTPKELQPGGWHIPYLSSNMESSTLLEKLKISSARCARNSYLNHLGDRDPEKDYKLHDRLIKDRHMTPFEHQAMCSVTKENFANFQGWKSYRFYIEQENDYIS